jgi:hypothetical protein
MSKGRGNINFRVRVVDGMEAPKDVDPVQKPVLSIGQCIEPDYRTSSAATTVVNNPKITSAGINPGSLPGSGSGIVGAAADFPARNDNAGITTRMQNQCLGMAQSSPAFGSADHAEFA